MPKLSSWFIYYLFTTGVRRLYYQHSSQTAAFIHTEGYMFGVTSSSPSPHSRSPNMLCARVVRPSLFVVNMRGPNIFKRDSKLSSPAGGLSRGPSYF